MMYNIKENISHQIFNLIYLLILNTNINLVKVKTEIICMYIRLNKN